MVFLWHFRTDRRSAGHDATVTRLEGQVRTEKLDVTVNVVLGGMAKKPVLVEGRLENREYLCVTVSVDHDIVDGAPAARFVNRFAELIECGFGLVDEPVASG